MWPGIKENTYVQGTMASGYLIQGGPRRIEGQRTPTAGCLVVYRVKADVDSTRNARSGGRLKHGIKAGYKLLIASNDHKRDRIRGCVLAGGCWPRACFAVADAERANNKNERGKEADFAKGLRAAEA